MAEDLELELDENNNEEIINRKDNRIKSLSDKVKLTSEERDTLAKEKEEFAKAKADAEKERDFFKGFNQVSSKYPNASEYQDKIWEKVKGGYDIEDAAVAILNKEGKFTPAPPIQEKFTAAGGSASTAMKGGESKAPNEMSHAEVKAALLDLEARGEFHL